MATLNRFISRSLEMYKAFYDILNNKRRFEWSKEYEDAFPELKRYLSLAPLLVKPLDEEPLLYLSVSLNEVIEFMD